MPSVRSEDVSWHVDILVKRLKSLKPHICSHILFLIVYFPLHNAHSRVHKNGTVSASLPSFPSLHTPSTQTFPFRSPKALILDLMGTCLDWHTPISAALTTAALRASYENAPSAVQDTASALALAWREAFFAEIHSRFEAGLPQEDIDETHRRTLARLLSESKQQWRQFAFLLKDEPALEQCVQAWHHQPAWPDVAPALTALRSESYDLIVLANGTTRLQLDLMRSSGLHFDLPLSSQLLGLTKPDPAIYRRAMELLKREPGECCMIAAHAYDVRAARAVGMRTVYLWRWTEDREVDVDGVREGHDGFVDARGAEGERGGLLEVVEMLRGW